MEFDFIGRKPFGKLNRKSSVEIKYDPIAKLVTEVNGFSTFNASEVFVSENMILNLPLYISYENNCYYPTDYNISTGTVVYHSEKPPHYQVKVTERAKSFLDGGQSDVLPPKKVKYDISYEDIVNYNSPPTRKRKKDQNAVMGMSANMHVQDLIRDGILDSHQPLKGQWHWCHLIAFSMLSEEAAQAENNLIAGTTQCNGQMLSIENAVKQFIVDTRKTVTLKVTATRVSDSHVANSIRYEIFQPKSQFLHKEYFNPLSGSVADYRECKVIYDTLINKFKR